MNFYARVYFDNKPMGTFIIDVPDETPEQFVPMAVLQAQDRIMRQYVKMDLMTEEEYSKEIASKTKIILKDGD